MLTSKRMAENDVKIDVKKYHDVIHDSRLTHPHLSKTTFPVNMHCLLGKDIESFLSQTQS